MNGKVLIGPTETVSFPELGKIKTVARVDTGAQTSAIWASVVDERNNTLSVIFFDKENPLYSGDRVNFDEYSKTVVINSTGGREERYKIRLLVEIGGKRVRARFTLANRSKQTFPVLIGRNILRGKFVVDISHQIAMSK